MIPSRRRFLQSAGVTFSLPFLPSLARGAPSAQPRRMVVFFGPTGLLPQASRPAELGPITTLPPALVGLEPVLPRTTVLTELRNTASENARAGCDHSRGLGTLLCDRALDLVYSPSSLHAAITFDQVAANLVGPATPFPSLQFGVEGVGDGFCSLGANDCAYQGTLSWASPTQPLYPIVPPRAAYDLLFAGTDPDVSARDAVARKELRLSVLDRVMDRTASLTGRLSTTDRDKLDQYLTGVRDLETRLVQLESFSCPEPGAPPTQLALPEHHELMRQLVVLAVQCDYTRILTFLAGRSLSELVYSHLVLNTTTSHHVTSHHNNDPLMLEDLTAIQAWIVTQYAELAAALAAVDDGEGGDLLSHTALVFLTEFGDSYIHDYSDLTFLIAGGEDAGWVHGEHRPQAFRPHSDLFLNLFEFLGIEMEQFGENGRVPVTLS